MTRLLVVRHAESTWNAQKRWQGQADPPLSAVGEAQAVSAVANVPAGWEAIVASDLHRARRTAELLAEGLDLPLRVEARLRERHAGPWQGLTRVEIDERWPGWIDDGRRPDGYEPDDVLGARTFEALGELSVPTIVVTHGGVIRVIERTIDAPLRRIPNLSALELARGADGFEAVSSLELISDGAVATESGG